MENYVFISVKELQNCLTQTESTVDAGLQYNEGKSPMKKINKLS